MAEHFSIPSQEEAERFSEAYLAAQQAYYEDIDERMYEWISVTERLPRVQYQKCLVCGPRGGMHVARFHEVCGTEHFYWIITGTGKFFKATHWMPLPEPPKEGGGEEC